MGLVKTMGTFRFIECDMWNCNKKIEQNENDEKALMKLAKLCGWEQRSDRWICSECMKKEPKKRVKRSVRSKKPAEIQP